MTLRGKGTRSRSKIKSFFIIPYSINTVYNYCMDFVERLRKIYFFILDSLQTILIVCGFLLVLYAFVIRPHEVSGQSMFPTYHDKEILLSNLLAVKLKHIEKGDVVVFEAPYEKDKLFIKRVMGIPGDRVMVKNGLVYLNGIPLDESSYLRPEVRTFGGAFSVMERKELCPRGQLLSLGIIDHIALTQESGDFWIIIN